LEPADVMYTYIMSHRTQITLTNAQYVRLKQESSKTGLRIAELVRQSLNKSMGGDWTMKDPASVLKNSFGTWKGMNGDGLEHMDKMRPGLGQRLSHRNRP
jgi:hypothetical protein